MNLCVLNKKELYIFAHFVVMRDVQERGRDLEQVLYQYTTFVKPAFEEFSLPVSTNLCLLKKSLR